MLGLIILINMKNLNKEKLPPWLEMYFMLISILKSKGIVRPLNMGSMEFSRYVVKHHPEISKSFCAFNTTFLALQYQSLTIEQKTHYQSKIAKQFNDCKRELKKISS